MQNRPVYLRPNVQMEPLVGRWFATVSMVPPATAAMNMVERQFRAMESFIQSPELHAASVRNPLLRSGPFIDLPPDRTGEVQLLLKTMRSRCDSQISFVHAIRTFGEQLRENNGGSLEKLYRDLPKALRGFVELYYDRHHRPDLRLYEALLYSSSLYNTEIQSIALRRIDGDSGRPFVFSTPRLYQDDTVELDLPFAAPELDLLFSSRVDPVMMSDLFEAFGPVISDDQLSSFEKLFTDEPQRHHTRYTSEKPRIRYFGHACLLIETRQSTILIDPLISYNHEAAHDRYTYNDLPEQIDYVLITHGHHDHFVLESLLQLRNRIGELIVPRNLSGALQDPSLALLAKALGFKKVTSLCEMETLALGTDEELIALPFVGEHHDLAVQSKLTYFLRFDSSTILVAADSCNLSPEIYQNVRSITGAVDILFLGMECEGAPLSWVYAPLLDLKVSRENDQARRGRGSNAIEGLDMVRCFDPKQVYVYAMGAEPWLNHILDIEYQDGDIAIQESNAFLESCKAGGKVAERLCMKREIRL